MRFFDPFADAADHLESDVDRSIQERIRFGEAVTDFVRNDPVGKHLYESARTESLNVLTRILFAGNKDAALDILSNNYDKLNHCAFLMTELKGAVDSAQTAEGMLHSPEQTVPES